MKNQFDKSSTAELGHYVTSNIAVMDGGNPGVFDCAFEKIGAQYSRALFREEIAAILSRCASKSSM